MLCSLFGASHSSIPNTCPSPIQTGFVNVNGCNTYYELSGTGSQTIVFVHFYSSSHLLWPCYRNFFCAQGYRVLLYDFRGSGFSSTTPPYTIDQYASDLNVLLQTLHINRPVVVGFATGGSIAMNFAALYPNNLSQLILLDASPKWKNDATWHCGVIGNSEVEQTGALLTLLTNNMAPLIASILATVGVPICPNILAQVPVGLAAVATFTAAEEASPPSSQYDIMLQCVQALDLRARLPLITVPTLITYGCLDPYAVPCANIYMAQHIPNSTIVGIPTGTHATPLYFIDALNQLILQFITGVPVHNNICTTLVPCTNCGSIL